MDCVYTLFRTEGERHQFACQRCGNFKWGEFADASMYHTRCGAFGTTRMGAGPGSELITLLKSLGLVESYGCGCKDKARQMDAWGIAGCREHAAEIAEWLRSGEEFVPAWAKTLAVARAFASGLVLSLRWSDPFGSLLREAIRRSEQTLRGTQGQAIKRLNLLYHILPKPHALAVWQWNVEQVRQHWHLFTGRKVVTLCTGDGLDSPDEVKRHFPSDAEFVLCENDSQLRDSVKFPTMMRMLESREANEATFVGHAKGASLADQSAVRPWTSELYRHCLGRWTDAAEALRSWPLVGPCKQYGHHLGGWHYVGAFYFYRHDAWYGKTDWCNVDAHGWGLETHPSKLFPVHDAYCMAYDGIVEPYTSATWKHITL